MPREAYLAGDQADVEVAVRILEDNPAFAANNGDILQCVAELLQKAELDRGSLANFDDARQKLCAAWQHSRRGTGGPK